MIILSAAFATIRSKLPVKVIQNLKVDLLKDCNGIELTLGVRTGMMFASNPHVRHIS
jgi:hypothetical protein